METLSLKQHKKLVMSALVMVVLVVPVAVFVVKGLTNIEESFAVEYQYPIPEGYTTIVDQNFYECVAKEFKKEFPSEDIPATGLTDEQLGEMEYLSCSGYGKPDEERIVSVTGIEKMRALVSFAVDSNKLKLLDLTNNTMLRLLFVDNNQLAALDLSNNENLETLRAASNQLESLILPSSGGLKRIDADYNKLDSLDLSNNENLERLSIMGNQLESLILPSSGDLEEIYANNNNLTSLDLSNYSNLKKLWVSSNLLTSLDLTNNVGLVELYAEYNPLVSINVSDARAMEKLHIYSTKITSIDLTNNGELKDLRIGGYDLLEWFNDGEDENWLTSLDVSHNLKLEKLEVSGTRIKTIDISQNKSLKIFRMRFSKLQSIDTSQNEALEEIDLEHNQLNSINTANNTALTDLGVSNNNLNSLDVSNNKELKFLSAIGSHLESLNITGATKLYHLYIYNNNLTFLDVSHNQELVNIHADDILIKADISISSENPLAIDLSRAKFIGDEAVTINNTDNYVFSEESHLLTINNLSAIDGYVQIDRRPTYHTVYGYTYRLQLPIGALFFNAGGGDDVPGTTYCILDDGSCNITIPSTIPNRDNYRFLGYANNASDTTAQYAPGDQITISNQGVTLYAVWAPIYTLTIDANGGSYDNEDIKQMTCSPDSTNSSCEINLFGDYYISPTREGHFLKGYADTNNATTSQYNNGATITMSGDKKIYAVWKRLTNIYTSVSGNGGSVSQSIIGMIPGYYATITFTPDQGYELDTVTVNSEVTEVSDNSLRLLADGTDLYVVATFKEREIPAYDAFIAPYTIDETNHYLDLTTFRNNINGFEDLFPDKYTVEVDTKTVDNKQALYTGSNTRIYENGTLLATYTNIVRGDANGDGLISIKDYIKIKKDIMKINALEGIYRIAGDVNNNSAIDIVDYIRVKKEIMKQ